MSLYICRFGFEDGEDGFIKIKFPGYKIEYSVLDASMPLYISDEHWNMITELKINDDITEEYADESDIEKLNSFRNETLKKLKNINSLKIYLNLYIDIGKFVDFSKILKFQIGLDKKKFLLKCNNLKELTYRIFKNDELYILEVLNFLKHTLINLELSRDCRRTMVEGLPEAIASLENLKVLSISLVLIKNDLNCLKKVRELTLDEMSVSDKKFVESIVSLNNPNLRKIVCKGEHGLGRERWNSEEDIKIFASNKYLGYFKYGYQEYHSGIVDNCFWKNREEWKKAEKECETLLCIEKYKRKEIGPLKHFCKQIGEYLYFMR